MIEHGLTSSPTQYRLYGRQFFYRSKDPTNSIEGESYKGKQPPKHKENTKYTYA